MDHLNGAASADDLAVMEASARIKPELERMAAAAPKQHKAVADFIAEKRKELGKQ